MNSGNPDSIILTKLPTYHDKLFSGNPDSFKLTKLPIIINSGNPDSS